MNNSLYTTETMQYVGEIALPHATGKCDICGTMFATGATFEHTPDGKMMSIGWVCADKLLFDYPADAKHLAMTKRRNLQDDIERRANLRSFVFSASPELLNALRGSHYFCRDIRRFVIQYPEKGLTEKQVDAILRVHAEEQRKNDGEKHKKYIEVPEKMQTGRQEVQGEVVSIKSYDNYWGFRLTMMVLIDDENGQWKCHGTCPTTLDAYKGDIIKFTAKFAIDENDHTFARFSRPAKAEIL